MWAKKKKKGSFQEAFFSSNIISREEMIGHFPSNKEGFVASSHACYIHNEHKIKEKQIEDKIDLFYEKLDIHGKKGRKKESVGGGM